MSAAERQGRSQEFLFGGPSVTLIYLSIQLLRTYIYTYARFFFIIYTRFLFDKLYIYKKKKKKWVPVSSTGKVSYGCIRDLGFNPCLYQKLIGVLV